MPCEHVLDPHERRHRDLDPRRDVLARDFGVWAGSRVRQVGGEGGADSRLTVAIAQPADLEVADRDEAVHPKATPQKIGRVAPDLELSERQRERAILQADLDRLDHGALGRRGAAVCLGTRHGERGAQTEIVEVGGESGARIERIVDRAVLPEQERVGVDGGGQVVVLAILLLRIDEGELGQREEPVGTERGAFPAKLTERTGGVVLEAVGQPQAVERLLRGRAGLVAGQRASRNEAMDVLRVGQRDADRREAGARQEQDADQRDERETST